MEKPVFVVEVLRAIFDMVVTKAPGCNGFSDLFYQANWDKVGNSLFTFIKQIFLGKRSVKDIKQTLIYLILKQSQPKFINQFRLISLCNVSYKCIMKIIVNRLKSIMPSLISPFQSSFILGWNIQDNIMIASEMLHSMKR